MNACLVKVHGWAALADAGPMTLCRACGDDKARRGHALSSTASGRIVGGSRAAVGGQFAFRSG